MQKAIRISLMVVAIAALAWASSDPWKDKPYQQWDEKDVQKVLMSSPWAKAVTVDAKWNSGAASEGSPGTQGRLPQGSSAGGGSSSSGGGGGRGGMGGGGGAPSGGGASGPGMGGSAPSSSTPQATFAVRWLSSRTIREAFVRNAVLSGRMKPEDAEKQVSQPVDTYQLLVMGSQMTPFESAEESALQQEASLTTKKGKQKIEASKVEFQRGPDGKSIQGILFYFPKKTASGEGTIGADEKGAEFVLANQSVPIKAQFDFSKMLDSQGRDL